MDKYINADKMLEKYKHGIYDTTDLAEMLNYMPAADVEEVRHGRWIMHIDDLFPAESTMECDQCHEEQPLECDDKYCPNCGAKMERSKE